MFSFEHKKHKKHKSSGSAVAFMALCWLSIFSFEAIAQPVSEDSLGTPVVTKLSLKGDLVFPKLIVELQLRTRANRRLLGIPGASFWVWLYQLGERGCCISDRISTAFRESGEPPAYLNTEIIEEDVERLVRFYQQEGFKNAQVTSKVDTSRTGGSVSVSFHIQPGKASYLRNVEYSGLEILEEEQQRNFYKNSILVDLKEEEALRSSFDSKGPRFSESELVKERTVLINTLRNSGYASADRDSVKALVSPVPGDSFDVKFVVAPGDRYKFGDIDFFVQGPEASPAQTDTLLKNRDGRVQLRRENEKQLKGNALLKSLAFEPGEWFDQSKVVRTKRSLAARLSVLLIKNLSAASK